NKLEPSVSFSDEFLSRAQYLYEVFRVIDGIALFINDHLNRFSQTLKLTGNQLPSHFEQLEENIIKLIQSNHLATGNIKIVFLPEGKGNLMAYITPHQYPTTHEETYGIEVSLMNAIRHNPNAKVMDTHLRADANTIKQQQNVYETLLVNEEGFITEGSRSNVFFIKGDELITPPLEQVLPGITRMNIIKLCSILSVNLSDQYVHTSGLKDMDALFISGTSRKVLPVNKVEDLLFDVNNPLLQKIRKGFDAYIENYIQSHKTH
ncbi:MAG: aminotransferase class IV, partial [Bacteroidales bacterium]|nr:aminotransferase class IV [Bacteroidales bacterium]